MIITGICLIIYGATYYYKDVSTGICPSGCTQVKCHMYETWNDDYGNSDSGWKNGLCSCVHYNSDYTNTTTCSDFTYQRVYSEKYVTILNIGIGFLVSAVFCICLTIMLLTLMEENEKSIKQITTLKSDLVSIKIADQYDKIIINPIVANHETNII
jgi:hypothetical protein